jgi:hypothetical protein
MVILLFVHTRLRCNTHTFLINTKQSFLSTSENENSEFLVSNITKIVFIQLFFYFSVSLRLVSTGFINLELYNLNPVFFFFNSRPISLFFGLLILETRREKCP